MDEREKRRQYYLKNKDNILKKNKEYYRNNKEKITEINKLWVENNKEKSKIIKKRYKIKHKDKVKKANREYNKSHKEQHNKYRREIRSNPDKYKKEKLRDRFRITLEQYNEMLNSQGNKCKICGKDFDFNGGQNKRYPCIDHDHTITNKIIIRGILCRNCNFGIGGFKDSVELLKSSIEWLSGTFKGIDNTDITILDISNTKKDHLKKLGVSLEQYYNMVRLQGNKCGICNKTMVVNNVDHSHITGKVRGILCPSCNLTIGLFEDNIEIIKNAIKYLTKEK